MLRCDITQFQTFLKELVSVGYINENSLFNRYGANKYDTTPLGDNKFKEI